MIFIISLTVNSLHFSIDTAVNCMKKLDNYYLHHLHTHKYFHDFCTTLLVLSYSNCSVFEAGSCGFSTCLIWNFLYTKLYWFWSFSTIWNPFLDWCHHSWVMIISLYAVHRSMRWWVWMSMHKSSVNIYIEELVHATLVMASLPSFYLQWGAKWGTTCAVSGLCL